MQAHTAGERIPDILISKKQELEGHRLSASGNNLTYLLKTLLYILIVSFYSLYF